MMGATELTYTAVRLSSMAYIEQQGICETLEEAKAKAAQLIEDAEAECQQLRENLDDELAQKRQDAEDNAENDIKIYVEQKKTEYSTQELSRIKTLLDDLLFDYSQGTHWISEIVLQSVAKIIGQFDYDDLTHRVIKTALNDMRVRWQLELRTSPDDLALVKEIVISNADSFDGIDHVVADPNLEPGDLHMVSASGISSIGLSTQLEAFEATLKGLKVEGTSK